MSPEQLKTVLSVLQTCTHPNKEKQHAAITACRLELARKPDFWIMRCPEDAREFLNMDEQCVITTDREQTAWEEYEGWTVTPYYAGGEVK